MRTVLRRIVKRATPVTNQFVQEALLKKQKTPTIWNVPSTEFKIVQLHRDAHGTFTSKNTWLVVNRLTRQDRHLELIESLNKVGVSTEEFGRKWRTIINSSSASSSLDELARRKALATAPDWVILYIVSHLVKTPIDSVNVTNWIMTRLKDFKPKLAPWALVLAIHSLARHRISDPMLAVINAFLELEKQPSSLQFDHMIAAVSRMLPSAGVAQIISRLLQALEARHRRLGYRNYQCLIRDGAVRLEVAKSIQAKLIASGEQPNALELERPVLEAQSDSASASRSHLIPSDHAVDRLSPVAYMRGLLRPIDFDRTKPLRTGLSRFASPLYQPRVQARSRMDRAITQAARAVNTVSASELLALTGRVLPRSLSLYIITTVILGLIRRKEYQAASEFWNRLERSGRQIDNRILSIVVQLMAITQPPTSAFDLLAKHARRGRMSSLVTTRTINSFCHGLLISRRPDLVLSLWDVMERLYGTRPDAYTIVLMLKASVMATRYADRSLRSPMLLLGAAFSFRKARPDNTFDALTSRKDVAQAMRDAMVKNQVRKDRWHNMSAVKAADQIVRQVLLGNHPELLDVLPPARALRTSADDVITHPLAEYGTFMFGNRSDPLDRSGQHTIRNLVTLGLHPPPYPFIPPTVQIFNAYIRFLGATGQASRIAQTLGWMRALDLRPTKELLAMALLYWGDVSMAAPMFEARAQRAATSEYTRLVRWIREWVGEEGLPDQVNIGMASQMLRLKRERGSDSRW